MDMEFNMTEMETSSMKDNTEMIDLMAGERLQCILGSSEMAIMTDMEF